MTVEPVGAITDIAKVLDTYGPWAVVAITIVAAVAVVWYIGKRTNGQLTDMEAVIAQKNEVIALKEQQIADKDALMLKTLEDRHAQFVTILREVTNALTVASGTNERLINLSVDISRQYEMIKDRLDRTE